MKKFLFQATLLIIGIFAALFFFKQNPSLKGLPFVPVETEFKQLQVNNVILKVEVADTQAKRRQGLGGRESLASDSGMLFIFPKPEKPPFWMKGLSFPLDLIWIRGDMVVDIFQDIQPPTPGQKDESLSIYQSKENVDEVLEVNAGTVRRLNIKVGDKVSLLP